MYARMPFGKHRGRYLSDIPLSYLRWLDTEADLDGRLAAAVREELYRREATRPEAGRPASLPGWEPLIKSWFARLAMRHHPDRGGTHQAMLAINDAHALLVEMLAEEGQTR